jgi:hypothetical protein
LIRGSFRGEGSGVGCRELKAVRFRVQGLGFRLQVSGFRFEVLSLGFWVLASKV